MVVVDFDLNWCWWFVVVVFGEVIVGVFSEFVEDWSE